MEGRGVDPALLFGGAMLEHVVPRGVPSMPLKRYISRAYPLISRSVLQEAFRRRDVKVNAKRCAPDILVLRGRYRDAVSAGTGFFPCKRSSATGAFWPWSSPRACLWMWINRAWGEDTLLRRIRAEHPGAQLLHRLDAATGGVLLAALDEDTLQRGLEAFQKKQMDKTYRAVVLGKIFAERGGLEGLSPGKTPGRRRCGLSVAPMPGAKGDRHALSRAGGLRPGTAGGAFARHGPHPSAAGALRVLRASASGG